MVGEGSKPLPEPLIRISIAFPEKDWSVFELEPEEIYIFKLSLFSKIKKLDFNFFNLTSNFIAMFY